MCRGGVLRVTLVSLAGVLALAAVTGVEAQGGATATVEVRVWQHVENGEDIHVNARAVGGAWAGLTALPLDDGFSPSREHRFGGVSFDVPRATHAAPVGLEVRIWQDVRDSSRIYVSLRPAGGSWLFEELALDDGFSRSGRYRYGETRLEVPLPGGDVTTLAGASGVRGYADGRGGKARFRGIGAVEVDSDGSVIVADYGSVRRIGLDGTVTTIARGFPCVGTCNPRGVAVAQDGTIYVAGGGNGLRRVTPDGVATPVWGSPFVGGIVRASEDLDDPYWVGGVAFDEAGNLYVLEEAGGYGEGRGIVRYPASGEAPTFQELVWNEAYGGRGFDVDDAGNVYLLDWFGDRTVVSKVDTEGVVGTLYEDESPHFGGVLAHAEGLAVAGDGTIYVANTGRNQIVRLAGDGSLVGVAGTGETGHLDGAPASALFDLPRALTVTPDGGLVVADQNSSVVRVIEPGPKGLHAVKAELVRPVELARVALERVSILAGMPGFHATTRPRLRDGPADQALFASPSGLALDAAGGVIVADTGNHAIRRLSPDGVVTTVAGGNGLGRLDGPAGEAQFVWPRDVAVDLEGTIYVKAGALRKVLPEGRVTTIDATPGDGLNNLDRMALDHDGTILLMSDGQIVRIPPAGEVSLVADRDIGANGPIAVDSRGDVYAFRYGWRTNVILKIARDGAVTTVFEDRSGDYGGLLSWAVSDLFLAPDGTLYVADPGFQRVIRFSPDGVASTVVDQAAFAALGAFHPESILLTPEGSLVVADSGMNVIWTITFEDGDGE